MDLGWLVLEFPISYLKGIRITMFQLSGVYYKRAPIIIFSWGLPKGFGV